ncbi:hypothetical protein ACNKF0_00835 [Nocardioides sp. T5]|uniref:hypothetical protein n=1 Tax=Nocardioides sp. T5 TaxID=3400182 RepID=UPI003A8BA24E
MTMLQSSRGIGSLSSMLGDGLRSLDITVAEYDQVVAHYTALGHQFADHWGHTRGDNIVTPQGSFPLGTVVRNVHRNDEIDLDAVAIRDIGKTAISQVDLKVDAGVPVRNYSRSARSGHPTISECERCWTLHWNGMHIDLLPAIPNCDTGVGILITDKDVRRWLPSHPTGYIDWFKSQMREALVAALEAKSTQIDNVPEWQVKTTLQQTVQALKRHRDIYFTDNLGDRPASVILTTLAARAYTGGDDVYEVLRDVIGRMGGMVEHRDGMWWVPNPVLNTENFADSWARYPKRAAWFFQWLEAATNDFNGFGLKAGLDNSIPRIAASFGDRFAKAASAGYSNTLNAARDTQRLQVTTGGTLAAATGAEYSRKVRRNGFAGGSPN